jgi:hypothetical protein
MDKRVMRSADKLGGEWTALEKRSEKLEKKFAVLRRKIVSAVRANGRRPHENPRMRILCGRALELAVITATKTKVDPEFCGIFMNQPLPRRLMRQAMRREEVFVPVAGAEKMLVHAGVSASVIDWFRRAVQVSRATPRVRVTALKPVKKARRK